MFFRRAASRSPLSQAQWPLLKNVQRPRPNVLRKRPSQHPHWNHAQSTSSRDASSRADRILSKLPRSMQKYTRRLQNAPVSHVVAFLILHEITAVVPLLGLFGLFHYTNYVPIDYMLGNYGGYVGDGVRRFERYFSRKGWFGFGEDDGTERARPASQDSGENTPETILQLWTTADPKYKIVVEIALAYAITKALLPVRILASLWATPWFAGVIVRLRSMIGSKR